MYRRILLAIDPENEKSWKIGLPHALELARAGSAELHLMAVASDAGMPLVESYFPVDFKEKALAHVGEILDGIVADELPDDVKVHKHYMFGTIAPCILDAIAQLECDLVVMASHKPDAIRDFLVGSNADRVVRRSPVSVLVVRG